MRNALSFAAAAEAVTGLGLLIAPSFVGHLLLGEQFTDVAIMVARVAGMALIGLGIACWPGSALMGMLIYSVLITLYLTFLGSTGAASGTLLWPAVVVHIILVTLLIRDLTRMRRA